MTDNPLFIGFDWSDEVEFYDAPDGEPYDISGWALTAEWRELNHSHLLLTSNGTDFAVTDGPGGIALLKAPADQNGALWPVVERYPGQTRFFDVTVFRTDAGRQFLTKLSIKGIT